MHDDITELKRDIGLDCGDHSCRYAVVRTGMRTNGGCRCEPPAKQIADLTRRLEAARAACGEHVDSDFDLAERIAEYRDEGRAHFHDVTRLTRRLEEAQRSYDALSATRDALQAKFAAAEQERDALLRLAQAMGGGE